MIGEMDFRGTVSPAGLLAWVLALAGCAPHRQYQEGWPKVRVHAGEQGSNRRHLAVVELDEQGDLWDTGQLRQALAMIRATPRPLLVTYVHGWRHDARPGDADLVQFDRFIADLNREKPAGYTACGIYIGWRGSSVGESGGAGAVAALLSFWDRKWATDRMADIGLSRVLNQSSAAAWRRGGRSVAIGHSFGGRILERTAGISSAAQAGTLDTLKPAADLVVLVNPASESLTARKLKLALRGWTKPYPLIVAIGAPDDAATGRAWPWGYRLSPQPRTRDYTVLGAPDPQRDYLATTVTHDPKQITHALRPSGETRAGPGGDAFGANLGVLDSGPGTPIWIRSGPDGRAMPYRLSKLDPRASGDAGLKFVLESDAYWTLQTPREVLSGHSGDRAAGGVFSVPMRDLMAGIFARAELDRRADGGPKVPAATGELKVTAAGD